MLQEKASSAVGAVNTDRHPLDPLSETELAAACDILKSVKQLGPDTRFGFVQLEEPAKSDVLGWKPVQSFRGGRPPPCSTARPAPPMSQRSISVRSA